MVEHGLTEEQINLFFLANDMVNVADINDEVLAYANTMGGAEAQKEISKILTRRGNALKLWLIKKEMKDG